MGILDGKVALVTGGSRGIGRMIAEGFIAQGATVYISSRKADVCDTVASELGPKCISLPQDVSTVAGCKALASAFAGAESRLDILVNNAGGQFPQPAEDFSPNGWRSIIDLNLNGTWNMTQALGRQMLDGRGGTICNIVMTVGRGNPGIAHSGAARAAVTELTRSLSFEWGPKVRINCVGPGSVVTEGFEGTYDDDVLDDIADTPIPHPGTVQDIANGVVFLVSPAGRFITGETLMIDGGVSRYGSNQALKSDDFAHRGEKGPDW